MLNGQDPNSGVITSRRFNLGEIQMRTGEGGAGDGGAGGAGAGNPPAPNPNPTPDPTDPNPSPDGDGKGEPKTFSEEYVRKLRDENAQRRIREKELADKVKGYEDEKLTAEQKSKRDLDAANEELTKVRAETRQAHLLAAAASAGATVPKSILGMIDGDGDPETEVGKVKKQFPQLFKPVAPGGVDSGAGKGPGGGKSPGDTMNSLLRRAAGRGG